MFSASKPRLNPFCQVSGVDPVPLGANAATHVVEFDVPSSELFLNDVGDVTLSNPVNLSGRNPILLPVPEF